MISWLGEKTVEDIKIPFELHFYEDGYIKDWIERKGFKVLGVYEPYCIHFRADSIWTIAETHRICCQRLKICFPSTNLFLLLWCILNNCGLPNCLKQTQTKKLNRFVLLTLLENVILQ